MGIQYVGSKTAAFAGTTATNTTVSLTSGLTGGIDTAVRPGDLVVVAYGAGSSADRTLSIKDASGGDYTLMGSELYANGTTYDANLRVAYKFMGFTATPDASVVLGPTGATADGGSYAIHVFRGVDVLQPMDATPTTATGTATSRPNPPSITPVTAGALVGFAAMGACATGTTAFTFASTTNLVQTNQASTNDSRTAMATRQTGWTSGAVDPAASTTGSSNAADSWASVTFALRPAPEQTMSGAPKIEASSFTATDGTANTIAARLPPGVVNGELLVAYVLEHNATPTVGPPAPTGWTKADEYLVTGEGAGAWMWKVASSEGATQSFATAGGTNRSQYVCIMRVSGADTSDPFDVGNGENNGTATARTNPGFTTAGVKSLALLFHDGANGTTGWPSGWGHTPSGDASAGMLYKYQDNPGAIGSVSIPQPSGFFFTHMAAVKSPQPGPKPVREAGGHAYQYIASGTTANNTSVTVPTSLANSLLVVTVSSDAISATACTGLTWNGVAMTQKHNSGHNENARSVMFYLVNPAPGNNTLALTFDGGSIARDAVVSYEVFSGVDQVAPMGASQGSTSSGSSMTLTHQGYFNSYCLGLFCAFTNPTPGDFGGGTNTVMLDQYINTNVLHVAHATQDTVVGGAQDLYMTFTGYYVAQSIGVAIMPVGANTKSLASAIMAVSTAGAQLLKTASLASIISAVATTTAAVSKTVNLAGSASAVSSATAAMSLSKPLAGSGSAVVVASTITPQLGKPLAAAASAVSTSTAALTTGALQSLAGAIAAVSDASASLTKTASLAAGVAAITNVGVADMSLGKALTGSGAALSTAGALLSNVYALVGAGSVVATANPALSKTSAQAGSAGAQAAASADLSKSATLAGAAIGNATGSMDLTKSVAFAAGIAALSTTTGALTRVATLAGSSAGQSYAEADILVVGDYAGTVISNTTATGNLSLTKPLAGVIAPAQANAFGNLDIRIPLVGSIAALSTVSATPGVAWAVSAQAMANTTASGDVSLGKPIAATVQATASGSADMQLLKRLAGIGAAEASTSGNVGVVKTLAGSAQSVASVTGDARTSQDQGDAYAECSASGGLTIVKPLAGAAVSTVPPINAFMFVNKAMDATLTIASQAGGDLSVSKPLSGSCAASTATTGDITKTNTLAASVGAECYSLGNIMVRKIMGGGGIGYVTAGAVPKYFLALASGIVVRSTAELFVPDNKIPGDVDAVIDVFVIHASVMSEDPEVSIDHSLIDVEVTG